MNNPITVTESLANGLKERFFSEMTAGASRAEQNFIKKKVNLANRNAFSKLSSVVNSSLKEYALVMYEGGTSTKPYLVFDLLTPIDGRLYNDWNEKCLTGVSFLFNYEPSFAVDHFTTYNISEHAISRVFLRTKPVLKNGTIDCKYIINEMAYIPFWSSFWGATLFAKDSGNFFENASPLIPAPNGMFMCDFSKLTMRPEVRTFVADSQLTEMQMAAKNLMIKVSQDLISSPMSFLLILAKSNLDDAELLHSMVASRILQSPHYDSIRENLFYRVESDKMRASLKNQLDSELRHQAQTVGESLENSLRLLGIKKFQTEIKRVKYDQARLKVGKNANR